MVQVTGAALVGVEAVPVGVEVDLLRRLPAMVVVGLPAPSVQESADRVRSAILGAGYEFPRQRVVISLAPADLRKDGTGFDLPIAVGILAAAGQVPADRAGGYLMVGELSLGGDLRSVRGMLAYAELARRLGKGLIVPACAYREAALVSDVEVVGAPDLVSVVDFLRSGEKPQILSVSVPGAPVSPMDLRDVIGQAEGRRALEIAAAGGHNLLFEGPPGCGKSMLASRLPSILPPLTVDEALECTRIQSVAGLRSPEGGLAGTRPFRAPHHSISLAGLVGGATLRPGEVSLAHHGVLFLDELPEFSRNVTEALAYVMSNGQHTITRGESCTVLPARFHLVAAANPCACGYLGHPSRPCVCSSEGRILYMSRLQRSPIRSKFDVRVRLRSVPRAELLASAPGEESATVQARVVAARQRQMERQGRLNGERRELPVLTRVLLTIADLAGMDATAEHADEARKFTQEENQC